MQKNKTEIFLRSQIKKQLNELFELSDMTEYVSSLGNLGQVLWNDIKFALSSLKLLKAIFTLSDSKAVSILKEWDSETAGYAKDNEQLSSALNKSTASLDLFIFAPGLAVGKMLASGTLSATGGVLTLTDPKAPPSGPDRSKNLMQRLQGLFYVSVNESKVASSSILNEKKIGGLTDQQVQEFISKNVPGFQNMRNIYNEYLEDINDSIQETLNNTVDILKEIYSSKTSDELNMSLQRLDSRTKQVIQQSYDKALRLGLEDNDSKVQESDIFNIFKAALNANLSESMNGLHEELNNLLKDMDKKGITVETLAASDLSGAEALLATREKIPEIFEKLNDLNPEE